MYDNECNGIKHRIKEGDTLYKLSRSYDIPLVAILRANEGVDVYNLIPGNTICIPILKRENFLPEQDIRENKNRRINYNDINDNNDNDIGDVDDRDDMDEDDVREEYIETSAYLNRRKNEPRVIRLKKGESVMIIV